MTFFPFSLFNSHFSLLTSQFSILTQIGNFFKLPALNHIGQGIRYERMLIPNLSRQFKNTFRFPSLGSIVQYGKPFRRQFSQIAGFQFRSDRFFLKRYFLIPITDSQMKSNLFEKLCFFEGLASVSLKGLRIKSLQPAAITAFRSSSKA